MDLTAQQYNVLRLLANVHPAALPTLELAGRLVSRAPDITRMLDKLEKRGFIRRIRTPKDRRVVQVALEQSGLQLVNELQGPLRQCHERQLGHLSRTKLKQLAELLRTARSIHENEDCLWR